MTYFLFGGSRQLTDAVGLTLLAQPWQLERTLERMSGVAEAVVMPIGQSYGAAVVTTDSNVTTDQVLAWCHEHLPAYACPSHVQIFATLPRSAAGKLIYPLIEASLQASTN